MKKRKFKKPDESMVALLKECGSSNREAALAAQYELAQALLLPLKKGVLDGDTVMGNGIYETVFFEPGTSVEFPIDFVAPGTEGRYQAYVIPSQGRIPEYAVGGDYIMVPTYMTGAALDWNLKYFRDARWDIMSRILQVLEAMFVRKMNNDGWHTIIAAAKARGITYNDSSATAGLFTKRHVSLLETGIQRSGGGNSTSMDRVVLSDLFISPESHQDVLSWDLTQVPEAVRQTIYMNWQNGGVAQIGRVKIHDLFELGVDQEYQLYYTNELGASMTGSKVEISIGLDLVSEHRAFVMPVREELQLFEDRESGLHRANRAGMYGRMENGFAVLDDRCCIIGEI